MKKLFALFSATFIGIVASLGFVGCGSNKHEHAYSDVWTTNSSYHWHEPTCTDGAEVADKSEHEWGTATVTVEATEESEGEITYTCTVCGRKKTEKTAKLTPYLDGAESLVNGTYALVFSDFELSGVDYSVSVEKLSLGYDENGFLYGYGKGNYTNSEGTLYNADVVLDESGVYVLGKQNDDYYYISIPEDSVLEILSTNLSSTGSMVSTLLPVITSWLNDDFLPLIGNVEISEISVTDSNVNDMIKTVINTVFVYNDGKYTLDFDLLKELNTYLYENTVSSIVNDVVGNSNTYFLFKWMVQAVLDTNIGTLVNTLTENGATSAEIVESVDNLLSDICTAMGSDSVTLKDCLTELGVDLGDKSVSEWLESEDVRAVTIAECVSAGLKKFGIEITASELKTTVSQFLDSVGKMTIYDIAGTFAGSEFDKATAFATVNGIIDELAKSSEISFTTDDEGNVSRVDVELVLEDTLNIKFAYVRDCYVTPSTETAKQDVLAKVNSIALTRDSIVEQSDFQFVYDDSGKVVSLSYVSDSTDASTNVSVDIENAILAITPQDENSVKVYFVVDSQNLQVISFTYNTSTNKASNWQVENLPDGSTQTEI
jgi:hypothetical protein